MLGTIEDKIAVTADAADAAAAKQAARTAQLEAVKQQLKIEQEARGNQVGLHRCFQTVELGTEFDHTQHIGLDTVSHVVRHPCADIVGWMVQDAMMLDEPGHMLDLMDEDRSGTAMHGRPKRRR